jgi:hypothetical protein
MDPETAVLKERPATWRRTDPEMAVLIGVLLDEEAKLRKGKEM